MELGPYHNPCVRYTDEGLRTEGCNFTGSETHSVDLVGTAAIPAGYFVPHRLADLVDSAHILFDCYIPHSSRSGSHFVGLADSVDIHVGCPSPNHDLAGSADILVGCSSLKHFDRLADSGDRLVDWVHLVPPVLLDRHLGCNHNHL